MQHKIAYTAGLLGMAALGLWIAYRRQTPLVAQGSWPLPFIELDDDTAAELIARYVPAVEQALQTA